MNRDSKSVFVTGGSGFIGRHIVHGLKDQGYSVRMLSRRKPEGLDSSVRVVLGDLTQPESYADALEGVSSVVHAALTDSFSHDLAATSKLYQQSAKAGVRRFVHLSTISVYGNPASGTITEDTAPIPLSGSYAATKLAIEGALRASTGCPEVAILRLGCVYGPGGGWWTRDLLNMMSHGKLILVNGGTGLANLIHVKDVAAIILLLLERTNPALEIYNVTDGEPVAWSRYFADLEHIFGHGATVSMDAAEARNYGRKWLHPSFARRVMRKLGGTPFIHPLDDQAIAGFASQAAYSSEKAFRVLGFRPAYDLAQGMRSLRLERDSVDNEPAGALVVKS